jgi:hypothetical protein
MSPKKKNSDPATELAGLIRRIKDDLVEADKVARQVPEASSVRPVISQAKDAFSQVGFSAQVGRLTDA